MNRSHILYVKDIRDIIQLSSKNVFSELEEGEKRILRVLAENGFLNVVEIDRFIQKRNFTTLTFSRWGVKDRLVGSFKFSGLIPNGFVQKITINKKESKYGLTLKGILAMLGYIDFNKIYQIKKLIEFLSDKINDRRILQITLDFIECEIALILYYNVINGINWKNFLYLESYWDEFKEYDQRIMNRFFLDKTFRKDFAYNYIIYEYIKYFRLLDFTTEQIICYLNNLYSDIPEFEGEIRKYIHVWYKLVPLYDIKKKSLFSKFIEYDGMPDYSLDGLEELLEKPTNEAGEIFEKLNKTDQNRI